MNVLVDTHALLWFVAGSRRLSRAARRAIEDPRRERYVSAACLWEMAIEVSLGRLQLDVALEELVATDVLAAGLRLLDVRPAHAVAVARLPFHHRDPFDRMLVAQAKVEGLALVSADRAIARYGVERVW